MQRIADILAQRAVSPTFTDRTVAIHLTIKRRGVCAAHPADDRSIQKVCALAARGKLPEHLVMSAAEAVLHCRPHNPVAYFFRVLHQECKQRRLFLYDLLVNPSDHNR